MFAVRILPETVFTSHIRNGATGGGADTHGDNQQLAFFGLFGDFQRGVDRIFAIAENDERIGAALGCAAFEILHGFAKHESEVGAAHTRPAAVYLLERIAQRGVVVGKRHH